MVIYDIGRPVRVSLFGISRSGKNYTINDFLEIARSNGYEIVHYSPIDMIRERLDGRKLSTMPINEKIELVREVRSIIDMRAKVENIIVDEHFCFPSTIGGVDIKNGYYDEKLPHDVLSLSGLRTDYEVVYPRFESCKNDIVAYMDINSATLLERFRSSEGCKKNTIISKDEIEEWMTIEKMGAFDYHMKAPRYSGIVMDPKNSSKKLWDIFQTGMYNLYVDRHPEEFWD